MKKNSILIPVIQDFRYGIPVTENRYRSLLGSVVSGSSPLHDTDGAEMLFYPTAIGSEPQDETIDSKEHWQTCMLGHAAANLVP
jgi:predicted amidohydrolase